MRNYTKCMKRGSFVLAIVLMATILAVPLIGVIKGKNQPQEGFSALLKSDRTLATRLVSDPILCAGYFSAYATDEEWARGIADILEENLNSDEGAYEFTDRQLLYFKATEAFAADLKAKTDYYSIP